MWPFPARRNTTGRAFVASAQRVRTTQADGDRGKYQRLIMPWQQAVLGYYDTLGECWYPAQFYGRALSQIDLFVARRDGDEIVPVKNDTAQQILDRVRDPGGNGRSNLLRTYGQLTFLIGEARLLVTGIDTPDERWEMVSPNELRINPGEGRSHAYTRWKAPQLIPEQLNDLPDGEFEALPNDAVVYRFWKRHPNYSALADSPTKAVQGLFDLLTRLRAAELSHAKSRVSNGGLLFIADEISFKAPGPSGNDDDPNSDPFMKALTDALVAPINDIGSAAASAPPVFRIGSEFIKDKSGYDYLEIRPKDMANDYAEMIEKVIQHIALGLDIPPEVMTGLSDTNHWNAWMIKDDTWQSHLHPAAAGFCDDLTTAYFRSSCRDNDVDGWEDLMVWYDASKVINHPDRGADADAAFERGAIGYEAYRDAKGFEDTQAPKDPDELATIAVFTGRDPSKLPGNETQDTATTPAPDETPDLEEGPVDANSVDDTAPDPKAAETRAAEPDAVTASLQLAASMALDRCRELAGARIRAKLHGDRRTEFADVPSELLASAVTFEGMPEGVQPGSLVKGGVDNLRRALVAAGITDEWTTTICDAIEVHAARTLWDAEATLPQNFALLASRAAKTSRE